MDTENKKPAIEFRNVVAQPDADRWRVNPPTVLRGDMREAMELGRQADKMTCECWNTHCPFHGDCRKCIVFHMSLKQFPTCQRAMLEELYTQDLLDVELHINHLGKPAGEK